MCPKLSSLVQRWHAGCVCPMSTAAAATVVEGNGNANSLLSPGFIGLLGSGLRCRVVENAGCILLLCES